MDWFKSLFVEGNNNPSIGSVCMAFIVLTWAATFLWSTYYSKPLMVTLDQLGIFCGVVYGLKKIPSAFKGEK